MNRIVRPLVWIVALAAIHASVAFAGDKKTLEERVLDLEARVAQLEGRKPAPAAPATADLSVEEKAVLVKAARTFGDGIRLNPTETILFRQASEKIEAQYGTPFHNPCVTIAQQWNAANDEWAGKVAKNLNDNSLTKKWFADPRVVRGTALRDALEAADVPAAVKVIREWQKAAK